MPRVIQLRWLDEEQWRTVALADDRPDEDQLDHAEAMNSSGPPCIFHIVDIPEVRTLPYLTDLEERHRLVWEAMQKE